MEQWLVRLADGRQAGPIVRAELDAWMQAGRINAQTQLLRLGSTNWVWASEVYRVLTTPQAFAADGTSYGKLRSRGSDSIDRVAVCFHVLGTVYGLLYLLVSLPFFSAVEKLSSRPDKGGAALAGIILLAIFTVAVCYCGLYFGTGWGLQRRRNWARILAIVLAALSLGFFPIGTTIAVYAFVVLCNDKNASAFR
jgi:hypothetical protein